MPLIILKLFYFALISIPLYQISPAKQGSEIDTAYKLSKISKFFIEISKIGKP